MTFEELKAEAEKQGYKLIKNKKYVKLLHCPNCGKAPSGWRSLRNGNWSYMCECGERAEGARTKTEARRLWNDYAERKEE